MRFTLIYIFTFSTHFVPKNAANHVGSAWKNKSGKDDFDTSIIWNDVGIFRSRYIQIYDASHEASNRECLNN